MANVKNYVLLETITVGAAGASSVTFNNIPQTGYTDLKIVISARASDGTNYSDILIKPNGSTTGYTTRGLQGSGSGTSSFTDTSAWIRSDIVGATATASTFNNSEIYIPNYTSSNPKSFSIDAVNENNGTAAIVQIEAAVWNVSPNVPITSIVLARYTGTFVQYSTFSLYGIAAVGTTPTVAPYAAGGDIIQTDGTYWYHAFLSSGTFTPAKALSADVLVVAGGGAGGGSYSGGGGGAGGLLAFTSQALTASTSYTCTIGAGGAGGNRDYQSNNTNNGNNSQFGSLTAAVGGGAGGVVTIYVAGKSGGSGGGAGGEPTGATGGAGTSGQGYAGGNGSNTGSNGLGGGGGGAGQTGFNSSGSTAGAGGAGVNTYSSWLSVTGLGVNGFIAGGGGGGAESGTGGAGGAGGGGAGAKGSGGNGTMNTGSGGGAGGGTNPTYGGSGGSGIVIVRYAVTA